MLIAGGEHPINVGPTAVSHHLRRGYRNNHDGRSRLPIAFTGP